MIPVCCAHLYDCFISIDHPFSNYYIEPRSVYIYGKLQAELLSRALDEQIRFFMLARSSVASASFSGNIFEAIVHGFFGKTGAPKAKDFAFKRIWKKGRNDYREEKVSAIICFFPN